MNKDDNAVLLDDVLTAFRREGGAPTPDVVDAWCGRFPRFADAIAEEAMAWAEEEMMAALHRTAPEDEAEVERARSRAFAAVGRANLSAGSPGTFEEALQAVGLDHAAAARQMGLPRTVVRRLVCGEVMGATIPETLTAMLSRLLGLAQSWVLDRYPATLAAAHGAECRTLPDVGFGTISFQDAVADADDATEEETRFWLEEA